MIIGCCFIFVIALLINKASLDVTVVGFTGSSIVLPCSLAKHGLKIQDISVLWRDKDNVKIYDLIKGKASVEKQGPQYKNRAETFPHEYERGNCSIKLINLTQADEGDFSYFIIQSSYSKQEIVRLFINESTVETGNPSTEEENEVPHKRAIVICICTILFIVVVIACFIIWRRKRVHKCREVPASVSYI
ncbi:CD276 antigen homolog isoform X3 [Labeo rohita]|uniref:CD276 antigen homolog isoform X3 n=1 Tax=Labeo rohita TaxID=84645 RepID=UPI0021E31E27|nr:CD276 antigen homolog isoform X3 [Labeo rohita]